MSVTPKDIQDFRKELFKEQDTSVERDLARIAAMKDRLNGKASERLDILIVDDCPATTEIIADIIGAERNIRLRTSNRGIQALLLIGERRPDVIITDLCMPDISGLMLFHSVSDRYPGKIKFLLISGTDYDPKSLEPCSECAYLPKPFSPNELVASLSGLLGK